MVENLVVPVIQSGKNEVVDIRERALKQLFLGVSFPILSKVAIPE